MPTLEKVRELAANFERSYPEELPAQLAWWAKVLEIDRSHMLRLMGMDWLEIVRAGGRPWSKVIEAESDRAAWLEELLCQLVAIYSYDWSALSADLKREREAEQVSRLRARRARKRPGFSGSLLSGRKTTTSSPAWRPRLREKAMLIRKVHGGGPGSLTALRRLLSMSK
jgi:DNA-binding transcriptional ArsR family regulator